MTSYAEKLADIDDLAQAAEAALALLPTTSDEIAAFMQERGIHGHTTLACQCVLANYLHTILKDSLVVIAVCATEITVRKRSVGAYLEVPDHVGTFVRRFDRGDYRHLESPHVGFHNYDNAAHPLALSGADA